MGNSSAANISFGDTFQNHSGTNSSKVDKVPAIVLTQDVQDANNPVVFSGSPEPCVSNLGLSHECSGVLMFVLKIK